jgi:hypothetical protein
LRGFEGLVFGAGEGDFDGWIMMDYDGSGGEDDLNNQLPRHRSEQQWLVSRALAVTSKMLAGFRVRKQGHSN